MYSGNEDDDATQAQQHGWARVGTASAQSENGTRVEEFVGGAGGKHRCAPSEGISRIGGRVRRHRRRRRFRLTLSHGHSVVAVAPSRRRRREPCRYTRKRAAACSFDDGNAQRLKRSFFELYVFFFSPQKCLYSLFAKYWAALKLYRWAVREPSANVFKSILIMFSACSAYYYIDSYDDMIVRMR